MPTTSFSPPLTAADVFKHIRREFDALTPELQRAARWIADHPGETGFLSMRQQAKNAGVSAPTMVRLARALGFDSYAALRRPFQDAMAGRSLAYGSRVPALQSAPEPTRSGRLAGELASSQLEDVRSVRTLNTPAQIDAVVRAIAGARRVGFLGMRASFGVAFQFCYAYNLIARNGVLFDGLGGTVGDQVEVLDKNDVLIAISQSPYSTPAMESARAALRRGVTLIALTDSTLSPLASGAAHTLRFRTDSVSFFPGMIAPLALVELLLARLAAKGGKAALERLAEVELRMTSRSAYLAPVSRRVLP